MTAPESKSKYMNIKVETATGNVVEVVDEKGKRATLLSQKRLHHIYQSKNGFKQVGTILFTHSSPGCVIVHIGGKALRICS